MRRLYIWYPQLTVVLDKSLKNEILIIYADLTCKIINSGEINYV